MKNYNFSEMILPWLNLRNIQLISLLICSLFLFVPDYLKPFSMVVKIVMVPLGSAVVILFFVRLEQASKIANIASAIFLAGLSLKMILTYSLN